MKKLFSTLFVVFFATSLMAQTGLTCEDAIPVDNEYTARIGEACELWYTAHTYDLPMHVFFSPDSTNMVEEGPIVEIDFSCTGTYDDPQLDSVINILLARGVVLPVEIPCTRVVRDGKWHWDLLIDKDKREQLTELGLTHDIQAVVKVTYLEGGSITMTADTAFQSCIDHGHYAKLGDTIEIAANDSAKMIVFPYSEWKKDSIRFVWLGENAARIWVAEDECRFTPVDASQYVKAKYDVDNNTPKKLYPSDMNAAIDNWVGAGIFYAKVISDAPGKLVVERIPLGEIQGGATLLKHGEPVRLQANDSRVFCFPKSWNATEFLANTQYLMAMHVSNTPDFQPGDANVLTVYPFTKADNKRLLQLTSGDISNLGTSAKDDYLYVRFTCNSATTMTPLSWNVSSCLDQTIYIPVGQKVTIPASSKNIYRMNYEVVAGYDLTLKWEQKYANLSAYVASYCDFVTTATDKLKTISVRKNSSTKVNTSEIDSWSSHIEDEGFLYIRFTSSRQGNVTFTSSRPEEEDPIIPSSPCVASSIELKSGDQLTLNLDSAFTIYRIEYAAWKEQGMSLSWTGTTDLHTFIAETCTFAVAPYNKYVHVYVPVQGEHTLDANAMADLAEYVDEDGYLYIRFLTEKEGVLTVK